jgi:protein disulfide-isomerase A6
MLLPLRLAASCCWLLQAAPAKVCFIAFLPNILDTKASGRNAYLDILKQVASKYKSRPFSYLWTEGGKQTALEQSFGVGGAGYPALVAYSPKQQQFSIMKRWVLVVVACWKLSCKRAWKAVVCVK